MLGTKEEDKIREMSPLQRTLRSIAIQEGLDESKRIKHLQVVSELKSNKDREKNTIESLCFKCDIRFLKLIFMMLFVLILVIFCLYQLITSESCNCNNSNEIYLSLITTLIGIILPVNINK